MRNSSEINWARIGAESAAIVASILLAFAIDAWWDQRNEKARAEELLSALEAEWGTEVNRIDERIDQYSTAVPAMIRFLNAHAANDPELSHSEAIDISLKVRRWSTYKPSTAAFEVLQGFGLDHVENLELRMAIASWPSIIDEITPEQEALHQVSLLTTREHRARIADSFERPWYSDNDDESHGWFGVEPGEMAIAFIRDHEGAQTQRHVLNLMHRYRVQLLQVRQTLQRNLDLLRAETGSDR